MELAARLGLPVREADLEPYDVRQADEVWSTSTTVCMIPVTRFNFRPVGDGRPGPIYRRLLAAWSEEVGVDIAGQAREYAVRRATWKP
jgi:branched-subunit amino acid aminotransferase/4-amino-4-deoxychorismate lyase